MGITEHKTIDALLRAIGKKGTDNFNLYMELLDLEGYETADTKHSFYGKCLEDYDLASKISGEEHQFSLTKNGHCILEKGGWLRELLRGKKEEEKQLQQKRMERIAQVSLNKQITVENLARVVQECLDKIQANENPEVVVQEYQNQRFKTEHEIPNWSQMKSTIAVVLSIASLIISLLATLN